MSDYRLLLDGDVTWRQSKQKSIDLRLILLNKSLLILTRQDEKLMLKFHHNPINNAGGDKRPGGSGGQSDAASRYWTPVLSLEQLTVKDVAHDPRALFLYWPGSTGGPQMYEIIAATANEQKIWVKEIRSAIEGLQGCVDIMSAFPQTATVSVTSSSTVSTDVESPEEPMVEGEEEDGQQRTGQEKRGLEGYRESKRRKSLAVLTSPSAVTVTQTEIMDAELVLTPFGN